jgi:hypothetical protein
MINFGRFISAIPLAGALLLASCGGGGGGDAPKNLSAQQPPQGIAVGEPNPSAAPDSAKFIAMARSAQCTDFRNRLYLIDQKYVYWDRAGNCADASYAQVLYGADIDKPLCSTADTIAGPRTSCSDESVRPLFEGIQQNRDKPDLGFSGRKVDVLLYLPKESGSVQFMTLVAEANSAIHAPQNLVVRDEAALAKLWAEHTKGMPAPPAMPKVDFSRDMVLAAFAGYAGACEGFAITRVTASDGSLVAEVQKRGQAPNIACIAVVLSPVHMVTVPRSAAEVKFVNVSASVILFTELARSNRSLITTAANHVVRNEPSWNALWAAHSAEKIAAPKVDFDKYMVLATFAGSKPSGCNATEIEYVLRVEDKIVANVIDWIPGPAMLCTANIVTPAHFVMVERSDDPVEFYSQTRSLK